MFAPNAVSVTGYFVTLPSFKAETSSDTLPVQVLKSFSPLKMEATVASWNRVGGWNPNAFILPPVKACPFLKAQFKEVMELVERYSVEKSKACPREPVRFRR